MNCCCCVVDMVGESSEFIWPLSSLASRQLGHHVVSTLFVCSDDRYCSPHFLQFLRVTKAAKEPEDRSLSQEEGDRRRVTECKREVGDDPTIALEMTRRRAKLRDIARTPWRNLNPANLARATQKLRSATSDTHPSVGPQTSVFAFRRGIRGRSGQST